MPQIELLKIHTHAGVEHGAGAVIDVDDSTANWLIEHGVGQAATCSRATTIPSQRSNPSLSTHLTQGVTPHEPIFLDKDASSSVRVTSTAIRKGSPSSATSPTSRFRSRSKPWSIRNPNPASD